MVALQSLPEIGRFEVEVFGARSWRTASRFSARCDAVAHHEGELLLLSVVGAETSVKSILAGLRSSGKDQERLKYGAQVGSVTHHHLQKSMHGYRVYRQKLAYDLWHCLALGKRDGFLPVLSEDSLWYHLQGGSFTTPLVRDWAPWLMAEMLERKLLVEAEQAGCKTALLVADGDVLDALVSEGVREGHLSIRGANASYTKRRALAAFPMGVNDLDGYLTEYGALLGKQAERSLEPLHVPGRHEVVKLELDRNLYPAQAHLVTATAKALRRQKALFVSAECGCGKSIMSIAAFHAHANGRPYRALVMCPPQLVLKWEREIRQTVPAVEVVQIPSWKGVLHLDKRTRPAVPTWYVISRETAKLGSAWKASFQTRRGCPFVRCPSCGLRVVDANRERIGPEALGANRHKCEWVLSNPESKQDAGKLQQGCGSPLWSMTGERWKYEAARFIKRKLRGFFRYLVLDESQELKGGEEVAQANAAGSLAAACGKVIAMTGTLTGGLANHLRALLFRLAPQSLLSEGLGWSDLTAFNERYGKIETRIVEKEGGRGADNRMSRGSKSTSKKVQPGIMPALFGRHLIDKTVFLSLSDVAEKLPPLPPDECIPVVMDRELEQAYVKDVESPLRDAVRAMVVRGDKRLLGAMLQTLLAYPDHPFGWGPIGYYDKGEFVTVTIPPRLSEETIRPKEQALIDLVRSEKPTGRQVWAYVQFTDKRDVLARLEKVLSGAGLRVGVLRSSVKPIEREAWIAKKAPGLDVMLSHPQPVQTGLDFFDEAGRFNFCTLAFYEEGFNPFHLRQASRRAWRIGQKKPCRVVYFYYSNTLQEKAMALMGKKIMAALALEGQFSSEGLAAMAGDDGDMSMALARSLVSNMDEGDARRAWGKVGDVVPMSAPSSAVVEVAEVQEPAILPFRDKRGQALLWELN